MKKIFLIIIFIASAYISQAQELFASVTVNSQQISGSDKTIFEDMQTAIREFVNNRKWTNYTYKPEEKIECNFFINITERTTDVDYKATIQVQSRRPVYNTSFYTPMLNLIDKDFSFKYIQNQALEYDDNNLYSNLTAVVAYYAYMIIGVDFDSFTLNGGSEFYQKAQNLVTLAQNSADRGWKSFESKKNRYWLVENLLNNSYGSGFRECLYYYHFKGMDNFKEDMNMGRLAVITALEKMQNSVNQSPGLYFPTVFMDTKRDEIINIFGPAPAVDKPRVVNILKIIDPSHSNDYNTRILNKN
jgi:Flp pilus assembly protein TadG